MHISRRNFMKGMAVFSGIGLAPKFLTDAYADPAQVIQGFICWAAALDSPEPRLLVGLILANLANSIPVHQGSRDKVGFGRSYPFVL